jgi:hypothetical protein
VINFVIVAIGSDTDGSFDKALCNRSKGPDINKYNCTGELGQFSKNDKSFE